MLWFIHFSIQENLLSINFVKASWYGLILERNSYQDFFMEVQLIYRTILFSGIQHSDSVFLCGSDGKESACNAEESHLIPGSGRSPGEEMATHSSILAWDRELSMGQSMHTTQQLNNLQQYVSLVALFAGAVVIGPWCWDAHNLPVVSSRCIAHPSWISKLKLPHQY